MSAYLDGSLLLMFSALSIGFFAKRFGLEIEETDRDGNVKTYPMYKLAIRYSLFIYVPYSLIGALLNWGW